MFQRVQTSPGAIWFGKQSQACGPGLVRDKLKWRPQAFAVVRRRLRVLGAVCDLAG